MQDITPVKGITAFDGSAKAYKAIGNEIIKSAHESLLKRDFEALEGFRKFSQVFANTSSSVLPHSGYEELEHAHEELLDYHEKVNKESVEDVTQLQTTNQQISSSLKEGNRSQGKICGSSDTISLERRPKRGKPN
jgi:DUF438 domain-containing protein